MTVLSASNALTLTNTKDGTRQVYADTPLFSFIGRSSSRRESYTTAFSPFHQTEFFLQQEWKKEEHGSILPIMKISLNEGTVIATEDEWAKVAKEVWPQEHSTIDSMFIPEVNEFELSDISKFINLMKERGYDGAVLTEMDPRDRDHQADIQNIHLFANVRPFKLISLQCS